MKNKNHHHYEFLLVPKDSVNNEVFLAFPHCSVEEWGRFYFIWTNWASLGGSVNKESVCNAGDPSSIPGGEDLLEKEMATHSTDRGAWRAIVREVARVGDNLVTKPSSPRFQALNYKLINSHFSNRWYGCILEYNWTLASFFLDTNVSP